ncbi:hypothetical protein GUITHDRAFT_160695 [Guillardia theta CCMP2712]|uniref:Carboxymuconolactone decarboxylase-like domain-containing protein n=1 Tax=Guillardia theta (strain CCMP2712) TaxID=905079 RepID=L1K267_GUITC|nr:hypothetical protein GUITHDRAFT_160695 [Guillardia theta CCMP2712]EKX54545.1 hypothetical protein GUITHDRAFT_160695 [Guillardia theta CCMP2712]|eukprot:XP_005841525.1 hypothetical protein GUITHDRAFT_160695 [Guillardia theta CCMP2712]
MSLAFANIRLGLLAKTVQASRAFERSIPALYLGGSRLYTNATSPTPKEIVVEKGAGKLKDVARDWKYVPKSCHPAGMEAILQLNCLVGFPKTINAFAAVQKVGVERTPEWQEEHSNEGNYFAVRGDAACEGGSPGGAFAERGCTGDEACSMIYGEKYQKLRARMAYLHPLLDRFMVEHAYGRVIGRAGCLPLRMRELCVVSVLSGQDVPMQLASHVQGALNVGATQEEVLAVLENSKLIWGEQTYKQAIEVAKTVFNQAPK